MRLLATALLLCGLFACPSTGHVGDVCEKHDDCKELGTGYCARVEVCTRSCSESQPCPTASLCVAQTQRRVCLPECTEDAQCPTGFGCRDVAEGRVCRHLDALAPPPKR